MLSFDDYRLDESSRDYARLGSVADLQSLEAFLVRTIESRFDAFKSQMMSHVQGHLKQNQGFFGKVRNWWGNWLNGTTGESAGSLPLDLAPFADESLLRELEEIMEGPIDAALAQVGQLLDGLKTGIIRSIRDGFQRNRQAQALAAAQAAKVAAAPKDKRAPLSGKNWDDFPPSSIDVSTGPADVSRHDTGLPTWEPYPLKPAEPEGKPEPEPEPQPAPVPEPEPEEKPSVVPQFNRKPVAKKFRHGKTTATGPVEDVPPAADAVAKKARFRRLAHGRSEWKDTDPLDDDEARENDSILADSPPEVAKLYQDGDPRRKRSIVSFISALDPDFRHTVVANPKFPELLGWMGKYDEPKYWTLLGKEFPNNPKLFNRYTFEQWAADKVGQHFPEGFRSRAGVLLEAFRRAASS